MIINGNAYHEHKNISAALKSHILQKQLVKARTLTLQGNYFCLDNIDNKNSHTIYYNWSVSDDLIKFTVKSRLNILPTNFTLFIWDRNKDPKCSLCGHSTESMAHMLNSCVKFKNFRSRRHDRIVSKIVNFITKCNVEFLVYENKMISTVIPNLREEFRNIQHCKPDIICITRDTVIIIEITICYDLYMNYAYDEKVRRYTPLVTLLRDKGYRSKLIVICFGSLGTVEKSVFNSLMLFNREKSAIKKLLKWCSVSVIIAGNYIWRHRVGYMNMDD